MTDKIFSFPSSPEGSGPPKFELPEPVRVALDLQRERLFDAMGIVQAAAAGIARVYDCDKLGNADFPRALLVANRLIDRAAGRIEPDELEHTAITPEQEVRTEMERLAMRREDRGET